MGAPGYLARARIALLGAWVGAMLAFGGMFVPAAFEHLPTQTAATVLRDGFGEIDRVGVLVGATCAALGFAARPRSTRGRIRAALPLAGVLAHLLSAFAVNPQIHALREAAGGAIGQADGSEVAAFAQLHALSRGLFGLAAASALLACLWDVLSLREGPPAGASPDGESGVF